MSRVWWVSSGFRHCYHQVHHLLVGLWSVIDSIIQELFFAVFLFAAAEVSIPWWFLIQVGVLFSTSSYLAQWVSSYRNVVMISQWFISHQGILLSISVNLTQWALTSVWSQFQPVLNGFVSLSPLNKTSRSNVHLGLIA